MSSAGLCSRLASFDEAVAPSMLPLLPWMCVEPSALDEKAIEPCDVETAPARDVGMAGGGGVG